MPAPPFWLAPLAGVSRNGGTREDYLELFGWGHRYRWVQWQAGLAAGALILGETVTLFYSLRINLGSLQAHNNSGPSLAASVTRSILTLEYRPPWGSVFALGQSPLCRVRPYSRLCYSIMARDTARISAAPPHQHFPSCSAPRVVLRSQ